MSEQIPEHAMESLESIDQKFNKISKFYIDHDDIDELMAWDKRLQAFIGGLRKGYPDIEDYALFHLIASSSPHDTILKSDLPNGVIENFINQEFEKIKDKLES